MVLAGQLHCLALYHAPCPDSAEATQRREVGTGPLVSPEEGEPRPENHKGLKTSEPSGQVPGEECGTEVGAGTTG